MFGQASLIKLLDGKLKLRGVRGGPRRGEGVGVPFLARDGGEGEVTGEGGCQTPSSGLQDPS